MTEQLVDGGELSLPELYKIRRHSIGLFLLTTKIVAVETK